jgi:streptogramin lyase
MKPFIFLVVAAAIAFGLTMPACQKPNNSTPPINPSNAVVTTLAGPSFGGSTAGAGSTSSFNDPEGIAVDAAGNVYVGDVGNNLIRKISPSGVVTTLAGAGQSGSANGTGTAASFFGPWGIAVDNEGNAYVADNGNNMIRKISPTGVVTTLAGSGTRGSANGTGTVASFYAPIGVAVDAAGNVYVADNGNQMIREINPSGVVTTLAGSGTIGSLNGTGTAASFRGPTGVAVDATGNVYVGDWGNNVIRKISPSGVVTTLAGSGTIGSLNGTGTAASFFEPFGVAVDAAGNVYVADQINNLIRKINPSGVVSTLAGSGAIGSANGVGPVASFNHPTGIAVDASGNVYVADAGNNLIRKITQ